MSTPIQTTVGNPESSQTPGAAPDPQLGQTPQQQPAPGAPAAQPTLEDVMRERDEARAQAQQFETRFKDTQSAYTRSQQILAQVTGNPAPQTPPADPLAPYVQQLKAQGYDEKDARAVLSVANQMMEPLRNQMQQSYQALQGQTMVDDIIYQAAQAPEVSGIFQNPAVIEQVRQGLRTYAQHGHQLTPDIAADMAILVNHRMPQGQQQQQQPAPMVQPSTSQQPQPFARGMFNLQPSVGTLPTTSVPAALPPEVQRLDDEIKQRYNLK